VACPVGAGCLTSPKLLIDEWLSLALTSPPDKS
jgi:hypothetical protein